MRFLVAVAALASLYGCNTVGRGVDLRDLAWDDGGDDRSTSAQCQPSAGDWMRTALVAAPNRRDLRAPLATPLSARGRTYYVSPHGSDAYPGERRDRPWRSIERVNQHELEPGDRVLFQAGERHAGNLVLNRADSGSAQAPVTIGSYGDGRATLAAGEGSAIHIVDASGFVIQGLELRGDWQASSQSGSLDGSAGIKVENNLGGGERLSFLRLIDLDISGFKAAGISIAAKPDDSGKGAGFEAVEIASSDVHDNGDVGIVSSGPFSSDAGYSHRGILVHRVRAFRNRGLIDKNEHTGSGIVLSDVDGALIERSVAYENGEFNDSDAGGGFGIWAWDANAVVIQHNEAHGNRSQTGDGGGFDLDGGVTDSVVQYNYSHDNHGAGYGAFQFAWARPHGDNVIRFNISQNDGMAFSLWDGNGDMGSVDVYHNVSYGQSAALVSYSPLHSVRFINNILHGVGETLLEISDAAGLSLLGNDYWTGPAPFRVAWNVATTAASQYASFDAFLAGSGQESIDGRTVGHNLDPRLLDAGAGPTLGDAQRLDSLTMYQLDESSPLRDRGVELSDLGIDPGCMDFFGNRVPFGDGFDIGAHEFSDPR
jgi:hypothetical protein